MKKGLPKIFFQKFFQFEKVQPGQHGYHTVKRTPIQTNIVIFFFRTYGTVDKIFDGMRFEIESLRIRICIDGFDVKFKEYNVHRTPLDCELLAFNTIICACDEFFKVKQVERQNFCIIAARFSLSHYLFQLIRNISFLCFSKCRRNCYCF